MRSLQATVAFLLVLLLLCGGYQWVVHETLPLADSGATLSRSWLVVLALSNWFARYLVIIALVGFVLAAGIGALVSRGTTLAEERRLLLYWLLLSVPGLLLPMAAGVHGHLAVQAFIVLVALGLVQPVASVVVAIHLQSRLSKTSGSRVRAWHVAVVSVPLYAIASDLVALPCLWVWWRCGKAVTTQRRDAVSASLA